jgi:phosphoribosylglycinamide formyltransferase 1
VPVGFATYDPRGLRFAWLRGLATDPDTGIFGPFGVDPAFRGGIVGHALLTIALAQLRTRGFKRALIPAVGDAKLIRYYMALTDAREAERFDVRAFTPQPVRTIVLASGSGSNFQAVLDRVADGGLPLDIAALVSNNAGAYAIERARTADVACIHVLPWQRKAVTREQYDARLLEVIASEEPELVLLLGWMHILNDAFIRTFPHLINVHPAYLPLDPARDDVGLPDGAIIPAFRGPRAVRDALAASSPWVGASVHLVTNEADRGPILMRVSAGEAEASVMDRLHPIEHRLVERGIRRWLYER